MREFAIKVCGDDAAVLYFDSKIFLRKLSAPLKESLVRHNWINKFFFIYQVSLYIYGDHYVSNIFRKANISYPMIRTRSCAYLGVKNVSFSVNFANVINE